MWRPDGLVFPDCDPGMQAWVVKEMANTLLKRVKEAPCHSWPEFWRVVSEEQVIMRSQMQRLRVIPPRTPSSPRLAYYRAKQSIRRRLSRQSVDE